MTVAQMIADIVAVVRYLLQRFGQDNIYLLGHSWGSYLGLQVAAAEPKLFHVCVGMGQISYQLRSEVAANRYMMDQSRVRGDAVMVRRLKAAPVSMTQGLSAACLRFRDQAMHRLGIGTTRDMSSVISGVFVPVWQCRAYTLREKIRIWQGMRWSRALLWEDFITTDLSIRIQGLAVPMFFFTGRYDLTANHDLAAAFFDRISAPVKGVYTFKRSAQSPLFEEPERARHLAVRRSGRKEQPCRPEARELSP